MTNRLSFPKSNRSCQDTKSRPSYFARMASLSQWLIFSMVHSLPPQIWYSIILYLTSQSESDENKAQNDTPAWNRTWVTWSKSECTFHQPPLLSLLLSLRSLCMQTVTIYSGPAFCHSSQHKIISSLSKLVKCVHLFTPIGYVL